MVRSLWTYAHILPDPVFIIQFQCSNNRLIFFGGAKYNGLHFYKLYILKTQTPRTDRSVCHALQKNQPYSKPCLNYIRRLDDPGLHETKKK